MHGHLHVTDPCATSVMLPVKPPDVPSDIWELELPSILGAAHPAYREGNGTPPPHSSLSILSSDDGSSPDPELTLNTEDLHQSPPATTQVHPITSADTLFQEWNVAEHQTWLHLDTSTTSRLAAAGPLDPDAEKLATTLLLQDRVSFADLDRLLDLLPEKSSTKRRGPLCGRLPRQKCFSTGAYTFAHATGVQSNTLLYPRATQLLTSVIRGMNPTALFASLTLQRNTQVQMHRDAGNEPNTANTAIPCSRWRGGSLWVQSDGGAYALDRATGPGTMIRIGLPYAQFPPHRFHATVPWSGGDRTILLGFTPRRMERLLESDRTQLTTLGFQLHAATECRFECSNTAVG